MTITAFISIFETQNIILAGIIIFFISFFIRKIKNRRIGITNTSDYYNHNNLTGVKNSLDKLFVDIQEFSRTTISKIDTRIKIMEQILKEAKIEGGKLHTLIDEAQKLNLTQKSISDTNNHLEQNSGLSSDPKLTDNNKEENEYNKIIQLFNEGKSIGEISQATGLPRGEVELVISLKKRKEI